VDQHTLLKEDMNHKTKVNTSPAIEQANVVITTLSLDAVRQQLGDIESLVYTAQTLGEISLEQTDLLCDLVSEQAAITAVMRLDALVKSICRSVVLIQESAAAISLVLEDSQVAA
jgi:hypothetical protein